MATDPDEDDVIRIRIDTQHAVEAFGHLLAEQARAGEVNAPANPAATAVWRELAPFRLVEYAYLGDGVGPIDEACFVFPDGALYAVDDEIPERAVADLVSGAAPLPPIALYLLLARPAGRAAIESFLHRLSSHLGNGPVVEAGPADGVPLDRVGLLDGLAARSLDADGRAYAALDLGFRPEIVGFADAAARDNFVAWSRAMADWLAGQEGDPVELGLAEAVKPARPAPVPEAGCRVVWLDPPPGVPVPPLSAEVFRPYWSAVRGTIRLSRGAVAAG